MFDLPLACRKGSESQFVEIEIIKAINPSLRRSLSCKIMDKTPLILFCLFATSLSRLHGRLLRLRNLSRKGFKSQPQTFGEHPNRWTEKVGL